MKLSYEDIEFQCKILNKTSENIKNIFENIENSFKKFETLGCWQGTGYEYFYSKFKQIISSFEEVNASLANNIKYVEDMLVNYSEIDKQIINNVSNFLNFSGK